MADIDLKTATPDASIDDSAVLFGADSQASANPSVYSVGTVRAHFVGAGTLNVASGKTLTGSNTLTLAGTDATTMTFPSTSATLARTDAGNTFTGVQTINGGTVTTSQPVLNLTQTWNAGAVQFRGWTLNVTDTASTSGSLLMDLQVGGVSQFAVNKSGVVTTRFGVFQGGAGATALYLGYNGVNYSQVRLGGFNTLGFLGLTTAMDASSDVFLTRRAAANLRFGAADAAAPVAQTLSVQSVVAGTSNTAGANFTITGSQGTGTGAGGAIIFQVAPAGSSGTAQNSLATFAEMTSARAFNLYNTTDVTTNYERGKIEWASNVLRIGTEKAGTGTARALEFQTDGTTRLTIGENGIITTSRASGSIPVFSITNTTSASTYSAGLDILSPNLNAGDTQTTLRFGRNIASNNLGYLGFFYSSNGSTSNRIDIVFHAGAGWFFSASGLLQFAGTTSSFPALKRSSTTLQVRLADDSGFATIQGKLRADVNAVAETPTATHTITITDAAGTAYKVLCVAA